MSKPERWYLGLHKCKKPTTDQLTIFIAFPFHLKFPGNSRTYVTENFIAVILQTFSFPFAWQLFTKVACMCSVASTEWKTHISMTSTSWIYHLSSGQKWKQQVSYQGGGGDNAVSWSKIKCTCLEAQGNVFKSVWPSSMACWCYK